MCLSTRGLVVIVASLLSFAPPHALRAQDEATRSLRLEGNYLNVPVKTGQAKQKLRIEVDGQKVREAEIEVAPADPDFWVFIDVVPWRGKKALLRGPAAAIAAVESGDELRGTEPLYAESKRPQFHFSSRRGRLNDPNGLLYFAGEYHLFYQLHPYGWNSGSKHWGHAVSRDLVRWQELPIALYADESGMMFSGSGVVDWKNTAGFQNGSEPPLVLIYTATGPPRSQCLAYSNDRGRTWTKYSGNPVLPEVAFNNRDPKVFWHEPTRRWVMVLHCTPRGWKPPSDGSETPAKKKSGVLGIFVSPDLKQWSLASRIEGFFECPDLFELKVEGTADTKWVVHGGSGEYQVGTFDGRTFQPESGMLHGPYGGAVYAAQKFSDTPDGRTVQIAWARMDASPFEGMPFNQMMNFPCELSLKSTKDGPRLAWQPVREIETLRAKRHPIASKTLDADAAPLTVAQAECVDLRADIDVGTAAEIVWDILGVRLVIDVARQKLVCGKASMPVALENIASQAGHALKPVSQGNAPAGSDGPSFTPSTKRLRLRMLRDRGLLEVFAAEGLLYGAFQLTPVPDAPCALTIGARGGTARIVSLEADELSSAWPALTHTPSMCGHPQ